MKQCTFISGNLDKVRYLETYCGFAIAHMHIDLDEVQSLDLRYVTQKKAEAAYAVVQSPVLVEDVAFECDGWNGLPGTFIKFFMKGMGIAHFCAALPKDVRGVTARCIYDYFDGATHTYFEGSLRGSVPLVPRGGDGYGWDSMFVPEGSEVTRAEMSPEENMRTYLIIKPLAAVKQFLSEE
jgi:non-canonical purine NTP pyrophosphatase (RdgB/HAM1 family)